LDINETQSNVHHIFTQKTQALAACVS